MARTDRFSGLSEFLAVAELGSFRKAAAALNVSHAAISQAIRKLESRLQRTLVQRTTRSVALTDAGVLLLGVLQPAAGQIDRTIEQICGDAGRPVGRLRLTVPRIAVDLAVAPVLPELHRRFPELSVELDVNDESVELAAGRYDAGIRIGEWVDRDMVAVKLTSSFQWMVVGAPAYFKHRSRPKHPRNLLEHECIRYRLPTAGAVFRWEFVESGEPFSLDVPGRTIVNDHLTMLALAREGLGLAFTADLVVRRDLKSGALQPVLQSFIPRRQGLYLYFPHTTRREPKLRAFIEVATAVLKRSR